MNRWCTGVIWGYLYVANVVLAKGYNFFICHCRAARKVQERGSVLSLSPKNRPAKGLRLMNRTASIR